jgi:RimJ/RimL family protein N-acetyltransferase
MKRYIHQAVDARMRQTDYPFIVFDKVNQQYIGSTRFYDIQLANRTLQLGYTWYGKKYQGSGINKHCKYLMLEFAFETMKMERVEFRADNENKRSIQAMKNIGASIEGILRSNGYKANGQRRDSIVLSILKEEWFEVIKKELCLKLPVIILQ